MKRAAVDRNIDQKGGASLSRSVHSHASAMTLGHVLHEGQSNAPSLFSVEPTSRQRYWAPSELISVAFADLRLRSMRAPMNGNQSPLVTETCRGAARGAARNARALGGSLFNEAFSLQRTSVAAA